MYSLKRFSLLVALCSLAFLTYNCSDSSTGPDSEPDAPEFDSKAAPGDSAQSFLEGDQYTALNVEIDYIGSHEPTQEGLDSLRSFLERRLHKQDITFQDPTQISPDENRTQYSTSEIRSLEEVFRDNYTEPGSSTLQVYFLYTDGEYENNSNVLGIAYYNTSVAFFGQTIESISGDPPLNPSEEKVEGTVFRHEFGHNMGLVGNGTPTTSDHKTDGSAHCTSDGCLMEPAVETSNFFSNFSGSIPPLDDLCINDLQANGGK